MKTKILILISLLLFFSSCLIKLDKIDSDKGEVRLSLLYQMSESDYFDEIIVELKNPITGRQYTAKGRMNPESSEPVELIIDNVLYGFYNVTIRLKEVYGEEQYEYAVIKDNITVRSGNPARLKSFIGAPNNIEGTDRLPINGGIYQDKIQWKRVKSNYVDSNYTYDSIAYKLYIHTSPDFIGREPVYISEKEESLDLKTLTSINYTFVNGTRYYWRVIAENTRTDERPEARFVSDTWSFIYDSNWKDAYIPNKVSNEGRLPVNEGEIDEYEGVIKFSLVGNKSGEANEVYDTINYKLYISVNHEDFSEDSLIGNPIPKTEQLYNYEEVEFVEISMIELIEGNSYNFSLGTNYYWKVEAENSAGKSESDIWSFTYGLSLALLSPSNESNILLNQTDSIYFAFNPIYNSAYSYRIVFREKGTSIEILAEKDEQDNVEGDPIYVWRNYTSNNPLSAHYLELEKDIVEFQLEVEKTYEWWVQAYDLDSGDIIRTSEIREFTVVPESLP